MKITFLIIGEMPAKICYACDATSRLRYKTRLLFFPLLALSGIRHDAVHLAFPQSFSP